MISNEFEAKAAERARRKSAPLDIPSLSSDAAAQSTQTLFKLESVEVTGARSVPRQDIVKAYAKYLGRAVSKRDLAAISDAITAIYKEKGFALSRAFIPPQDIDGGRLRIRVVEGHIEDVVVEGLSAEWRIVRDMLSQVKAERPVRLATLERQMLLVADLPGVRVKDASIKEIGTASGRFRLTVKAQFVGVSAAIDFDNRGSREVGPWQAFSTVAFNSVARQGDAFIVNMSTIPNHPHELAYVGAIYDAPLGNTGLRAGVRAAFSEGWPGGWQGTFDTRTRTQDYSVYASYALLRTREATLRLMTSAGFRNVDEDDNIGPNYSDRVRSLSLTADGHLADPLRGVTFFAGTVRQGVGWLGASERGDLISSRPEAPSDFTKLNLFAIRNQAIWGPWSLHLALAAQATSSAVLRSESFFFGGFQFGRAFAPGAVYGDSGIAGLAELRFDQALDLRPLKGYQLYAFVDRGAIWTRGMDFQGLSSAGGGVRVFLDEKLRAGFEIATPLETAPGLEHGTRFMVSVSRTFDVCGEALCAGRAPR